MIAQANSLPLPLPPPPIEAQGTLDERIAQAELRLVAREQRLRARWQGLTARAQRATQPRRLMWPVLGMAAALLAAVWLLRRRGGPGIGALAGAAVSSAARAPNAGAARRSELPWVRGAALVWPLLPAHWRARFGPGTASLLVAVGLPLIEHWFRRRLGPALPSVAAVDWTRFAGPWHELAYLPSTMDSSCPAPRRIVYTPNGDRVDMLVRCAGTADPAPREMHGSARLLGGSGGAGFEFSLQPAWLRWLPLAWSERHIVHLDADYSVALVCSARRDRLALLSRHATLDDAQWRLLLQRARDLGFKVDRLKFSAPA